MRCTSRWAILGRGSVPAFSSQDRCPVSLSPCQLSGATPGRSSSGQGGCGPMQASSHHEKRCEYGGTRLAQLATLPRSRRACLRTMSDPDVVPSLSRLACWQVPMSGDRVAASPRSNTQALASQLRIHPGAVLLSLKRPKARAAPLGEGFAHTACRFPPKKKNTILLSCCATMKCMIKSTARRALSP